MKTKPAPAPNIDLGGQVAVIDFSTSPPRWKKVGPRIFATQANAKGIMRKHGLKSAWLIDDLGYKQLLNVK